jgi:tripartite-type tricarboxylate transporter receptor subunit TctC
VLVVAPAFAAQSVKEFIAYGIAHEGKLNHGSSGTGGTGHLTAEIFKSVTGMPAVVPYVKAGRRCAPVANSNDIKSYSEFRTVVDRNPRGALNDAQRGFQE